MRDICLPDNQLAARVNELAPELGLPDRVAIYDQRAAEPTGLADIRFWVPAFVFHRGRSLASLAEQMPRLEVIQAQSAGVEQYLPLRRPGLALCDARGVHGTPTAEWALTAILAVLREFPRHVLEQQAHHWAFRTTDELADKTVLVIGAGDVGEQLRRRLVACEAHPVMVARSARAGVHPVAELPALLPTADVVVVLVPKTSQTIGLVDAQLLSQMADGALLVNGSRGPVVDTGALLAELRAGRLRAALDVTDPEPLPADHPLWSAPNVLITPHVGGSVFGFSARVAGLITSQLRRFDAGQPLANVVTGEY